MEDTKFFSTETAQSFAKDVAVGVAAVIAASAIVSAASFIAEKVQKKRKLSKKTPVAN